MCRDGRSGPSTLTTLARAPALRLGPVSVYASVACLSTPLDSEAYHADAPSPRDSPPLANPNMEEPFMQKRKCDTRTDAVRPLQEGSWLRAWTHCR